MAGDATEEVSPTPNVARRRKYPPRVTRPAATVQLQPRRIQKMPGPDPRGSVFTTRTGDYGIRWPESGKRPAADRLHTKREAREWFDEHVAPRLRRRPFERDHVRRVLRPVPRTARRHVSSPHEGDADRTARAARERFGAWTLRELEGAAGDVAAWRASLTEASRYRKTLALRQALDAAVRWRYLRATRPSMRARTRSPGRKSCFPSPRARSTPSRSS